MGVEQSLRQITRELLGFFDVGIHATNEDDVMVLVITNEAERVLIEADARLSLELPNFRHFISMLMRHPDLETSVFLTTENELTGTLDSRNCLSLDAREELRLTALEELEEAIAFLYMPCDDPHDIWQGDNVLRLIHGQGLTAPHELDPNWQHILFPVRISDRVQLEREVAQDYGCQHSIDNLSVGQTHTVLKGAITEISPFKGLVLRDQEQQRTYKPNLSFFPQQDCAPLRRNTRDITSQHIKILNLLNNRFLPYLHGLRDPPVLHLLAEYGEYRIKIHYGYEINAQTKEYVLCYNHHHFTEAPQSDNPSHETYWANDLEDFLDGHCDEFTIFCRRQFPASEMRLWSFLSTPVLNSDLVYKKIDIHFERASRGLSPGSWVLQRYTITHL